MKRILVAVILLTAASLNSAQADIARDCSQTDDAELQVAACTKYLNVEGIPDDIRARVRFNRSQAYRTLNQFDLAEQDLSAALEHHPNKDWVYDSFGLIYLLNDQYERSIPYFKQAIDVNPENPQPDANLGLAYIAVEDWGRSKKYLERSIEIDSGYYESFERRAYLFQRMGDYERSIEDYNRALEIHPDGPAILGRGVSYAESGNSERAIKDFSRTIELAPNYHSGYSSRGAAYSDLGEFDRALEDFAVALELNPTDPATLRSHAGVLCRMDRTDESLAAFEELLQLDQSTQERVQTDLREANYYHGEIDGVFGAKSRESLKSWVSDGCPGMEKNFGKARSSLGETLH